MRAGKSKLEILNFHRLLFGSLWKNFGRPDFWNSLIMGPSGLSMVSDATLNITLLVLDVQSGLPSSLVVLADAEASRFEAVWRGVPVERLYCNLPHFKTRIRTIIDQKFSFLAQILHPKSISQKNHANRLFAVYYILYIKAHRMVHLRETSDWKKILESIRKWFWRLGNVILI